MKTSVSAPFHKKTPIYNCAFMTRPIPVFGLKNSKKPLKTPINAVKSIKLKESPEA